MQFLNNISLAGASLGNLSEGRVSVAAAATIDLIKAVIIGIHYSTARCQFGTETSEANRNY